MLLRFRVEPVFFKLLLNGYEKATMVSAFKSELSLLALVKSMVGIDVLFAG